MDKVKDLVDDATVYKKHDSFDRIQVKDKTYGPVFKVLEGLIAKREEQSEAVKRALTDIEQIYFKSQSPSEKSFTLKTNVLEELLRIDPKDYSRYLHYRYRYEIFPITKELDDFPPCIQIEPTSVCNFRCVFCYQTDEEFNDNKGPHMGTMRLDFFKKLIDQAEGKCEAITLASRGEPLICKEFGEMIAYMRGKFLASKMNTNASLMTEERCHEILSADLQTVVFSADAAEEPLYSQLRVRGKLDRVLKNIEQFNNIKAKQYPQNKTITRVSGVKVNRNQDIDSMENFWGELVDQVAFVAYNPWENTYDRETNEIITPCSDLWRRGFIWFDGACNPCDVDYKTKLKIGNAYEKSLSELWRSQAYEELRAKHLNKKRSEAYPCNRCTVI